MSRFYDEKKMSSRFNEAVAVMRDLVAHEGLGAMQYAYAEVTEQAVEEQYRKRSSAKPSSSPTDLCLCTLTGKKCPRKSYSRSHRPCVEIGDAADHVSLWNRHRKPFVYVSQPYGLSLEGMRSIVTVCDQYSLDARVDAHSWHYPGWTLLVEIHHKNYRQALDAEKAGEI